MEAVIFLSIIIALFSILVSCFAIRRVKKQIAEITDALIDVKNGNGNRRILSATNELVAPLAYEINATVKINAKIEEMEKESYRLVTMSFWGTERAVLVFKKGLKGSLL